MQKGYICQGVISFPINNETITVVKEVRKYHKEYTIQEVAKALGEEVGNFTIKQ
mgnify:FL=1